jgi:poly-gamma-glutamate synthesis protein (capsule biosynthesis protein)
MALAAVPEGNHDELMRRANRALKRLPALGLCAVMVGGCGSAGNGAVVPSEPPGSLTLLFAGDLMLGRGVAPIAGADPEGLFRDVRRIVRGADVAMANLESPLTSRPHTSPNPFALEADPASAELVAGAGFDVLSLANNHSGDAGREAIVDTVSAVEGAGMAAVGVGSDRVDALAPLIVERHGVRLAVLAFDASGTGLSADGGIGVARWDPESMHVAVRKAAAAADVVVVSLHGGVEYLLDSDPRVLPIAEQLVAWGADIVWGHGPHVVQPVTTRAEEDRIAVVATSLGNLLFDQRGSHTGVGAVLEVMVDGGGVIAHRVGATRHDDLRVHFTDWNVPEGDAGLVAGEWWELDRAPTATSSTVPSVEFPYGDVVAAAMGRVTGDNPQDLVVSFRHVGREHPVRTGLAEIEWTDAEGRTAHLGLYAADDLAPRWVAGVIPRPIIDVAACDGSIALAFSSLDGPAVIATGAARWSGFGLMAADELSGPGEPSCADIDGDGSLDPIVVGRG